MAVICDNTGIPVGSETCKLCVSHSCEGYKQATKQDKQWENLQKKDCAKIIVHLWKSRQGQKARDHEY